MCHLDGATNTDAQNGAKKKKKKTEAAKLYSLKKRKCLFFATFFIFPDNDVKMFTLKKYVISN